MERRKFIETTAKSSVLLLAGAEGLSGCAHSSSAPKLVPISKVKKPLAIAMWEDVKWHKEMTRKIQSMC